MASICSIGGAVFENGAVVSEWYSLIDPKDYFDAVNISIHGITERQVKGAPTFKEAIAEIHKLMAGQIVVTHTHFDRVAMQQAATRCSVALPSCTWLDSARVARRTWLEFAHSGYGISNVCKKIGYAFEHHNALEDAKASGHVMLAAMRESDLDLDGILNRVSQPISTATGRGGTVTARAGNPNGSLSGEVVVFTGELQIPRRDAADLAVSVGCEVGAGVNKKTTILVVGDVDVQKLAGHEKSAKHRKAEELVAKGFSIRIIRETDFKELVASDR